MQDPVTILTEGLIVGRLLRCELVLNHPTVSRVQAGFKEIGGSYYIFNLRPSNPALLNGKPVEANQALAPGDQIQLGPFKIDIDVKGDALALKVTLMIGMTASDRDVSSPDLSTRNLDPEEAARLSKRAAKPRGAPIADNKALDIFWDKRIREAGKMVRPSPLFPRSQRRSGKAQFNWTPTSDLAPRWPTSFFIWALIGIGLLSVFAAYSYTSAYAPAPIANAHATTQLTVMPPIAKTANAGSCTSCHGLTGNMEARCASCHTVEAFTPSVTEPHVTAGIGCVACHAEHRGPEFRAAEAALGLCSDCHRDGNQKTFNGRGVGTPHGGTFGYPVIEAKWVWGLSDPDWKRKEIPVSRIDGFTDEQWWSQQFHALHLHRLKTTGGLVGNADGEVSCSTCHRSLDPVDRETPRMTCGVCHNGKVEEGTGRILIASNKPNCTSCHVEHSRQ